MAWHDPFRRRTTPLKLASGGMFVLLLAVFALRIAVDELGFIPQDSPLAAWSIRGMGVLFVASIALLFLDEILVTRVRRRIGRSGSFPCPECRYPLDIGDKSEVTCPECGRSFSADGVRFHWQGKNVSLPNEEP